MVDEKSTIVPGGRGGRGGGFPKQVSKQVFAIARQRRGPPRWHPPLRRGFLGPLPRPQRATAHPTRPRRGHGQGTGAGGSRREKCRPRQRTPAATAARTPVHIKQQPQTQIPSSAGTSLSSEAQIAPCRKAQPSEQAAVPAQPLKERLARFYKRVQCVTHRRLLPAARRLAASLATRDKTSGFGAQADPVPDGGQLTRRATFGRASKKGPTTRKSFTKNRKRERY
jgi:hypothetical protein